MGSTKNLDVLFGGRASGLQQLFNKTFDALLFWIHADVISRCCWRTIWFERLLKCVHGFGTKCGSGSMCCMFGECGATALTSDSCCDGCTATLVMVVLYHDMHDMTRQRAIAVECRANLAGCQVVTRLGAVCRLVVGDDSIQSSMWILGMQSFNSCNQLGIAFGTRSDLVWTVWKKWLFV